MRYLGFDLPNPLFLAPMAGVTDRPFRQLCKKMGAGLAVSEMVASNSLLYGSEKTRKRADHSGEVQPIVVQIVGADPAMLAEAARYNVAAGAQIIDINMGCPAKKICRVAAGSALMQNETLVADICRTVVQAVPDTPVTLKCRTGWDEHHKNAVRIAQIAENAGIAAIAVHGRTRAQQYHGAAEYDTVAAVKQAVRIPVIANGDINSPEKARDVLHNTGVDALMIGRAAQGRPWLFREIDHFLRTNSHLPSPTAAETGAILADHLLDLYEFYGKRRGVMIARKHIAWYTKGQSCAASFRHAMNQISDAEEQYQAVRAFFGQAASQNQQEGELHHA